LPSASLEHGRNFGHLKAGFLLVPRIDRSFVAAKTVESEVAAVRTVHITSTVDRQKLRAIYSG
jgi:hypothetical protein